MYKYRTIKQKPYCSVPCSLSIIMNRRKIKHGSQEEIGNELGLIVPSRDKYLFNNVKTGKKPETGYGTQAHLPEFSIDKYFAKRNIPLKGKYYGPDYADKFKELIINSILANSDIMVCFNYKALYGNGNYGHVSLVEKIDNDYVTLIETLPNEQNRRVVSLNKLIDAIKKQGASNKAGLWIVMNTGENNNKEDI